MGALTEFFRMFKPAKTDPAAIERINEDLDIIDTEMHKPPLTVNGIAPGQDRDLPLTEVPLAGNLSSDVAQIVTGAFIQRVSGGGASIEDGGAFLSTIKGNSVHTGQIAESIEMTVNAVERDNPITATLDRNTFVEYVQSSQTVTLDYTDAWSANPALYGITVNGTPVDGDQIVVVYVKENRGVITNCNPTSFNATGWNLFNRLVGYARVCKYSDTYGFKIGGTYSLVEFATTVSGTRSTLTLEDGYFNVPSNGFVFVTGSDTTTYIYATFTDWTEGYQGDFEAYSVDTIDFTEAMLAFPYGLCAVGNIRDEINLNTQMAIKRIERFGYSAENLAAVIASGMDYDADESYIYAVMQTPVSSSVSISGEYAVSDHGIEYFAGASVDVYTEILYGENLKDKLRTDVLTISEQTLTAAQKAQVQENIGLDERAPFVVEFGSNSTTLESVLQGNWQTKIPNNAKCPTLCLIHALYGDCYGYLSLYEGKYGSGVLTKYDGKSFAVFLNNGTVSVRGITPEYATNANLTKVASQISNVERARYNKAGRTVVVGLTFTTNADITGTTEILFSGAPKAMTPVRAAFFQSDAAVGGRVIRLEANQYGNITNAYSQGGIPAGIYEGEIVYVCTQDEE